MRPRADPCPYHSVGVFPGSRARLFSFYFLVGKVLSQPRYAAATLLETRGTRRITSAETPCYTRGCTQHHTADRWPILAQPCLALPGEPRQRNNWAASVTYPRHRSTIHSQAHRAADRLAERATGGCRAARGFTSHTSPSAVGVMTATLAGPKVSCLAPRYSMSSGLGIRTCVGNDGVEGWPLLQRPDIRPVLHIDAWCFGREGGSGSTCVGELLLLDNLVDRRLGREDSR